jgi:hypothetical protein
MNTKAVSLSLALIAAASLVATTLPTQQVKACGGWGGCGGYGDFDGGCGGGCGGGWGWGFHPWFHPFFGGFGFHHFGGFGFHNHFW